MGFGETYISKSCKCEIKDKNNWIIVESKINKKSVLVYCNKCKNQWRTTAKYISDLKHINDIRKNKTINK